MLADFVVEFSPTGEVDKTGESIRSKGEEVPWQMVHGDIWKMFADGASNYKGSGAGIVIISPCGTTHEHALKLNFSASNNEVEYEALIAGLKIAKRLEIEDLVVYSDSKLVVNQVIREYEACDDQMNKYVSSVKELIKGFSRLKMEQVGRDCNAHADALAGLVAACDYGNGRTITIGNIDWPTIEEAPVEKVMVSMYGPSWMDDVVAYLKDDVLLTDKREVRKIILKSSRFVLGKDNSLCLQSWSGPMLK